MIAIINYDAGNTRSVMNALERLGASFILTDKPEIILKAEKVILPGVGHAKAAMEKLDNKKLIPVIKQCKQPFLGICLGMQLMYDSSEEGNTTCLGLIDGSVKLFKKIEDMRIPHMGWNLNTISGIDAGIMKGVESETYFVHSYYAPITKHTVAECHYYSSFTSYVKKSNFHGVQFHPEKSSTAGENILNQFLTL